MLHYSIAKLGRQAGRKAGTEAILQPVPLSVGAEKQYQAVLRAMLRGIGTEVRESVIPQYAADLDQRRREAKITLDGPKSGWFGGMYNLAVALQRVANAAMERIIRLEGKRHTEGFMSIAKKALGIDLRAVIGDEDIEGAIEAAIIRNVSLIKSLSDDMIKRVEQTVIENSIAGNSVKTLRSKLVEQFGIEDRRAGRIARDQMSKFHADLDEVRQTQAGIAEYDWSTSHDERVRPLHKSLDGKRYKWGKPTGAEQGLPPGKPVLCRCRARAVVVF